MLVRWEMEIRRGVAGMAGLVLIERWGMDRMLVLVLMMGERRSMMGCHGLRVLGGNMLWTGVWALGIMSG